MILHVYQSLITNTSNNKSNSRNLIALIVKWSNVVVLIKTSMPVAWLAMVDIVVINLRPVRNYYTSMDPIVDIPSSFTMDISII
jgi:hypothetical protein